MKDILEYSPAWPHKRWLPYEDVLATARHQTQQDLDQLGEGVRLTSKELEALKRRLFARHALAGTATFLEQHRRYAINLQMDFVDNPFRAQRA